MLLVILLLSNVVALCIEIDIDDVIFTKDQTQTKSSRTCVSTDATTSHNIDKDLEGITTVQVHTPVYRRPKPNDISTTYKEPCNVMKKKDMGLEHSSDNPSSGEPDYSEVKRRDKTIGKLVLLPYTPKPVSHP